MPEVVQDQGTSNTPTEAYNLIATQNQQRSTGEGTLQDVVLITAQSRLTGVTFSWYVTPAAFTTDGGPPLIQEKTGEVNAVMAAPHVQGFRTIQDQDASRLLVNYAIITVGTDDESITDEVQVRMDQINTPACFGAIAATWERLVAISGGALT